MNIIKDKITGTAVKLMEGGVLPDSVIRAGIRALCADRQESLQVSDLAQRLERDLHYAESLRRSPLAVFTEAANDQHYEVPAAFYDLCLGSHKKYSSCFFETGSENLDEAEARALQITVERAELRDGMQILELGCGWGSLTLFMAERFPKSRIVALSNSASQREYIESKARERGLENLQVLTRNIVEVRELDREFGCFDRVVSVEMFEHLRNYELLFSRISTWLKPSGKLFFHVFTHRDSSYFFETEGSDNWMGKYFFTGGQMPAQDLFLRFQKDLLLQKQWAWSGSHYGKTADAWLKNIDQNRDRGIQVCESIYGVGKGKIWVQRWRVFFMACSELFHYQNGSIWGVTHYLFERR